MYLLHGCYRYRRPGFNCVVKQLRFWLFKVDCEFKDCDLRVLRIGRTCIICALLLRAQSQLKPGLRYCTVQLRMRVVRSASDSLGCALYRTPSNRHTAAATLLCAYVHVGATNARLLVVVYSTVGLLTTSKGKASNATGYYC